MAAATLSFRPRRLGWLVAALCITLIRPAEAAGAPIALSRPPALLKDFAAFPRIAVPPPGSPSARIDKALGAVERRGVDAARDCLAAGGRGRSSWTRNVTVAMRSPRYLVLLADDSWYCGGAYPDTGRMALAYDIETGKPLNWQKLLPAALVAQATTDNAGDGTMLGEITSETLQALYVEAVRSHEVDPDCHDVLTGTTLAFQLWPDAKEDGIGLATTSLPHAAAACGPSVVIPTRRMRELGVDAGLLDAIDVAHRAGWFGPAAE